MITDNQSNSIRNEQDTAWKEILDAYFKDCITYCLPELSELIDWEKQPISLDKELQAITKGSKTGKRLLDKLFKVFLKDGSEQRVLIHIEVQATHDNDFPKRMFTYGYRIWDKYQQPLVSCAILTDDRRSWRPNSYEVKFAGSRLSAEFLVIKLIDYRERQNELEESTNPFASVILAQLAALDAKTKSDEQRKNIKFMLTKRLYDKGLSKQEISNLYQFIDWLIGLPSELEVDYLKSVCDLEETSKMAYITSAERFGPEIWRERWIKRAVEQAKLETARRLLAEGANLALIARVTELPIEMIEKLLESSSVES